MASFGGIDLGTLGAGVFELTSDTGDEEFEYHLANGAVVLIPPVSRYIVVRQCPGESFQDAHAHGREAANRALDLYHSQGGRPLLLEHEKSPFIVGWRASEGTILRIVERTLLTSKLTVSVQQAEVTSGNVIEPQGPTKSGYESLRYYRVSETSSDLFDSFRNLYLALEALLSAAVPPRKGEGEGDWLGRALRDIRNFIDLRHFAPSSPKEPHNAIRDELYGSLRTAIFHAKEGRSRWVPQDWASRSVIVAARLRYADMYRVLARAILEAPFPRTYIFPAYWQESIETRLSKHKVFVSGVPIELSDQAIAVDQSSLASGELLVLPSRDATDMAAEWCRGREGVFAASDASRPLPSLRSFGTVRDGQLAHAENLRAPLVVDGQTQLRVVVLLEGRNYGAPRQDFES